MLLKRDEIATALGALQSWRRRNGDLPEVSALISRLSAEIGAWHVLVVRPESTERLPELPVSALQDVEARR